MTTVAQDIRSNLSGRGILDSWLRHGFEPQGNQGRYPIFDLDGQVIGYRLKLLTGKQKYLWSPGKPKNTLSEWYILPGTADAIAKADGICYLANGEPALHAFHTAQVYNSLSTTLSEVSVPRNAVDILRQLGVTRLIWIADNDYAGYLSSINWRNALRGSGIDFEAAAWGKVLVDKVTDENKPYKACADVADKADGCDIWMDVQFNCTAFQERLTGAIPLPLPAPVDKPKDFNENDFDETPQGLIDAMVTALVGGYGYKVTRGWANGKSIFRDERRKSFGVNTQSGFGHDFATDEWYHPIKVAERLNIDWKRFYPQREKESQFTPQQIEAAQKRLEAHVAEMERLERLGDGKATLSINAMRYAKGDYRSWWGSQEVPKGMYSAVLNLANTRSETARVLGLIHKSLLKGTLNWVLFTEADVVQATGLDKRLVRKALQDLKEWSFVHFLSGDYIYNILHSETAQNYFAHYPTTGRKPQWYTINFDLVTICEEIFKRLEVRFREKLHRKTYAARTRKMAEDMGFDRIADWKGIERRNEIVMTSDVLSKRQEAKLQSELYGDGTHWYGWQKAMEDTTEYTINWNEVDSIKGLRSQLLLYHIQNVCSENTREDLRRLVGGSDSTLQSLYDDNHIATQQQFEKIDIAADFDDLRDVFREKQRDLRGVIQKVSFKYKGDKGWSPQELPLEKTAYQYATDNARIARVFMLVCKPSRQWLMSEEEIEAKLAEVEAQGSDTASETSEPKAYEPVAVSTPTYRTHEKKFSRSQDAIAIRMFSPHELIGDTVFDMDKEPVFKIQKAGDVERWLNDHALIKTVNKHTGDEKIISLKKWTTVEDTIKEGYIVKPYRNSDDTYIDWDMRTRLLLRGKREKHLAKLDEPEPIAEPEQKIIPLPLRPNVEIDERTRLFLEFCDNRWKREHKNRERIVFKPLANESAVDLAG